MNEQSTSDTGREITITTTRKEHEKLKRFEEKTGISPQTVVRQALDGGMKRIDEYLGEFENRSVDTGMDHD